MAGEDPAFVGTAGGNSAGRIGRNTQQRRSFDGGDQTGRRSNRGEGLRRDVRRHLPDRSSAQPRSVRRRHQDGLEQSILLFIFVRPKYWSRDATTTARSVVLVRRFAGAREQNSRAAAG